MIEECARVLESIAADYIACGNQFPDDAEERDQLYELAHSYHLAAEDIRRMNAEYRAVEARNLKLVRRWVDDLLAGKDPALPQVEPYPIPKDH
jgi:hypothetical protein